MNRLEPIALDDDRWSWGSCAPVRTELHGTPCVRLESGLATLELESRDAVLEVELAVSSERGFHGLVWRVRDEESFESFFVRPHQVGNPDAVQYTPVSHGISSWQLYHGSGFWAPVSFPLDGWFGIRVTYVGPRAEVQVAGAPTLAADLKRPVTSGRVGLMVGGPAVHVSRFACGPADESMLGAAPRPSTGDPRAVPAWSVSDPFPERLVTGGSLDPEVVTARTWTRLDAEPGGLADLARVNGIHGDANTVLVRATVRAPSARTAAVQLGFSDRAVVYLNGRALYRGDGTYRSRDYRFLGSIGYWDTLFLPLAEGDNELLVAVSEDLGGWGVQARLPDEPDLTFEP
jgi:hypothetical protein